MGNEALCTVLLDGKRTKGRALLETNELLFRVPGGKFRLNIPFRAMTSVKASDGELRINFSGGKPVFELGELAAKWAEKILNPKSLIDKLGVKPGARVCVVGVNEETFLKQMRERTTVADKEPQAETDCIFLAVESTNDSRKIRPLVKSLKKNGALWIVYPKGQKHFTENDVLAAGRRAGLKDVKVVSFSAVHTALKFVIPVSQR